MSTKEENIQSEEKDQKNTLLKEAINDKVEGSEVVEANNVAEEESLKSEISSEDKKSKDHIPEKDNNPHTLNEIHLPEKHFFKQELVDKFVDNAKSMKLTQDQASTIFDIWNKEAKLNLEKNQKEIKLAEEKLRNDWGDNYDTNLKQAAKVAKKFGGEDLMNFLDSSGLGNRTELIQTFYKLNEQLAATAKEDKFVGVSNKTVIEDAPRKWHGMPILKFNMKK